MADLRHSFFRLFLWVYLWQTCLPNFMLLNETGFEGLNYCNQFRTVVRSQNVFIKVKWTCRFFWEVFFLWIYSWQTYLSNLMLRSEPGRWGGIFLTAHCTEPVSGRHHNTRCWLCGRGKKTVASNFKVGKKEFLTTKKNKTRHKMASFTEQHGIW